MTCLTCWNSWRCLFKGIFLLFTPSNGLWRWTFFFHSCNKYLNVIPLKDLQFLKSALQISYNILKWDKLTNFFSIFSSWLLLTKYIHIYINRKISLLTPPSYSPPARASGTERAVYRLLHVKSLLLKNILTALPLYHLLQRPHNPLIMTALWSLQHSDKARAIKSLLGVTILLR